jgi:hypothetical protein
LAVDIDPLGEGGAMRRIHRAAHRRVWAVLAILVMLGFALALYLRHPA